MLWLPQDVTTLPFRSLKLMRLLPAGDKEEVVPVLGTGASRLMKVMVAGRSSETSPMLLLQAARIIRRASADHRARSFMNLAAEEA